MDDKLISLYEYAQSRQIDVDWIPLEQALSLSVLLPDGSAAIAVNPWKLDTLAKETVCLAHELGHCETGSFYNRWAALDLRQKHENRADKWAIRRLVPEEELKRAAAEGCDTLWQLAERFGVTEEFMKKAVCWYTHGNLEADLYL